ncbi:MAG: hypothetical protein ACXVLK_03165 [Acidimicrobiales bacterium]
MSGSGDAQATSGIGAVQTANAATGAPSVSLTTTRAGSLVFGVGNDWDNAVARTVGTGQTITSQFVDTSVGDWLWVPRTSPPPVAAGSLVTINDTAPTSDRWNWPRSRSRASEVSGRPCRHRRG